MVVDPRFYHAVQTVKLAQLIETLGLQTNSIPDISISGISVFADAVAGDLCFVDDVKLATELESKCTQGAACLTTDKMAEKAGRPEGAVIVSGPRLAFFQIAETVYRPLSEISNREPADAARVHTSAQVHSTAILGDGVAIGRNSRVGPYACIDAGVQIGSDCVIGASAQIGFSLIGNRVEIGSGARLGGAGFGLLPMAGGAKNTPHFGRLIVQDNVRIGANSCVDRGVLGDTVLGENTKIDNLCHVGHNTRIGRNVVMAAFAGISGSVEVGDNVMMGGRVGIVDHVSIGEGAQLSADSAVFTDVPAGQTWAGSPARPLKQWQRETVWLRRQTGKRSKD